MMPSVEQNLGEPRRAFSIKESRFMDDRRFDSLVRSLASGANRRQVLKGLLGIGGVAVAGARVSDAEAARRPTPPPKPATCPGVQTPVGGQGVCQTPKAPGTEKCGPDCCNPTGIDESYSECCDNACCYGECYGEELCCPYPREYCPVSGECCPAGWRCCPDYGCIAPEQCCTANDCLFQECFAAVCTAEHTCAYGDDCTSGGDCCEASACFAGNCQNDGTCGPPLPDCTNGSNCCTADACYRSECQNDGTCSQDVPDCRTGTNCCVEGECLQATGACCIPRTCDDLSEYACPSSYDDGCGGTIDCSDVCDERLDCVSGVCVNTTTTCYAAYCNDPVLGSCNTDGYCRTRLSDGALICTSGDYPSGTNTGACGDCTNDSVCTENPGDFCARDSGWVGSCPGCSAGGTGCSTPY